MTNLLALLREARDFLTAMRTRHTTIDEAKELERKLTAELEAAPERKPVGFVNRADLEAMHEDQFASCLIRIEPKGKMDFPLYAATPAAPDAQAEIDELRQINDSLQAARWANHHRAEELQKERDALRAQLEAKPDVVRDAERYRQINTPEIHDFIAAIEQEALHQRERWDNEHDAGKTDADWFWLVGFLAGKALHKPDKRLHHIITAAAACLNWHAHALGFYTAMRPGIDGDSALNHQSPLKNEKP